MRKQLLFFFILFILIGFANAQWLFDSFDEHPDSTTYNAKFDASGAANYINLTLNSDTTYNDGPSSLRYNWHVERNYQYGGYARWTFYHPESPGVWDLSQFKNLGLRYYVAEKSSRPDSIFLRIDLGDVSDASKSATTIGGMEVYYSWVYILEDEPGWNQIVIPLEDVGPAAENGQSGFDRRSYGGIVGNDKFDLDQIRAFSFEIIHQGGNDGVVREGTVFFDDWTFFGKREGGGSSFVFFNGREVPSSITTSTIGTGTALEIANNEEFVSSTYALKWTQGTGETGFAFDFDQQFFSYRWPDDTLKFWMKSDADPGPIRVQFTDADDNKLKTTLPAWGNSDWNLIETPLRDINVFESGSSFDTSRVVKFEIMADGNGTGQVVYFDNVWTGNPTLDITPPPQPSLLVTADQYQNSFVWDDVESGNKEIYNLYYSKEMITDINADDVEIVERGLELKDASTSWQHFLYSPIADSTVTYYYAITVMDSAGNISVPKVAGPVTNTARGIGTFSLTAPSGFAADGALGDWAGIMPITMKPEEYGHIWNSGGNITTENSDISVDAYLAADDEYFYFYFDCEDDVFDTSGTPLYNQDCPVMFFGLYDDHGTPHTGYQSGDNPDYHLIFAKDGVHHNKVNNLILLARGDADYYFAGKFPTGYAVEGRISWETLAAARTDKVFVPSESKGWRVPIDFAINDADGDGLRQCTLSFSQYNNNNTYANISFATHTWIGDSWNKATALDNDFHTVSHYELKQNYPNPFNPSTTIKYSLGKAGLVKIDLYNILGQKVVSLVNEKKEAGLHTFQFNASKLATGIYFYKIKSGSFTDIRKMVLMK